MHAHERGPANPAKSCMQGISHCGKPQRYVCGSNMIRIGISVDPGSYRRHCGDAAPIPANLASRRKAFQIFLIRLKCISRFAAVGLWLKNGAFFAAEKSPGPQLSQMAATHFYMGTWGQVAFGNYWSGGAENRYAFCLVACALIPAIRLKIEQGTFW